MSTRRKTTLVITLNHIVSIDIQGKSVLEVTCLLKILSSKADCKKVVDVYKVLLSFPLKHCTIKNQSVIYAITRIIIKALGCDYVANNQDLTVSFSLECIKDIKLVLRSTSNIDTLINNLVIITTNEKLESDIELIIMSFLTKVLSIIKDKNDH